MFTKLINAIKENRILAVAILVTLLVYARFLFFGHISWDDPEMVFKNKAVRNFDLKALFSNHYVGNYIPVTMLLHALAWLLFENSDGAHHLLNILLHILNGILVYGLGKRLFKSDFVANTGAIIFLLHPLQLESVAWIAELKNIVSTTFYLAALLSYSNFKSRLKKKDYFLTLLFFVLGCLGKSSVVVLPLSLICIDMLSDKKISLRSLINKMPFFLFSFVFGYINIQTQNADQFINHAHEFPIFQRVGFAGFALVKYLLLFLVPVNLSVIYPYPAGKAAVFVTGFIVLLSLAGLIIFFFRKKDHTWPALILFVLVNLILVLQLLPFGEVLYADRYIYIPIIGLAWMTGLLLSKIKIQPAVAGITLIVILSLLTFSGSARWKSAIVLYEDIIKKYPEQFIALNSAGVESMFLNEDKKALDYFNRAAAAAPNNYKSFYNRGLLYLKNKKPELAIKSFNQALELYQYNKAYTGRASAYYMINDMPKAMNDANFVLAKEPNNPKAHFVLGNCYNDLNKLDEAMIAYNKCIELSSEEPDYYFKRAIVSGKKQDFNTCLSDLVVCLELNPFYYEAYYWKGVAKVNLKQNPCSDFEIAARNNIEPAVAAYNKYCR